MTELPSIPPCTEEFLQECAGGESIAQALDLRAMVAGRLREEARAVEDRAAFGILGREHQPLDAREANCTRTHRARLERDEERGADEALIAELGRASAQHQRFGVRGRIAPLDDAVAVRRKKCAVRRQEHRADRYFAPACGGLGFGKRQCYGFNVSHPGPEEFGQD